MITVPAGALYHDKVRHAQQKLRDVKQPLKTARNSGRRFAIGAQLPEVFSSVNLAEMYCDTTSSSASDTALNRLGRIAPVSYTRSKTKSTRPLSAIGSLGGKKSGMISISLPVCKKGKNLKFVSLGEFGYLKFWMQVLRHW